MQTNDPEYMLSIVVPVYRSAKILPMLVSKIQSELLHTNLEGRYEIILVNDASPDESWQVILALASQHPFLKGISLRRNFGQHNATMAGLNYAAGATVVIMDDDLQHPPEAIPALVAALNEGFDVCYTNYLNRQHLAWKKVGSWFNNLAASYLLGKPRGLYLSSFKAVRKEVIDEVIRYDGPYAYVDGLILDVTRSITSIDIQHQPRKDGTGNYNLRKSLSLWLKMATSFSIIPLRLATYIGFLISALSFMGGCLVVVQKLLHPEVSVGWTSLISTVLFIGGVQILCIGMLGEYLGRAYLKLNCKPQFVISERTWTKRS